MVCAQSNTAVGLDRRKLLDRGVNVLRIGNPTRVNDKMLSFTYERKFESHPAYPTLRAARASIRELSGRLKRLKGAKRESARRMLHDLRDQAIKLEIKIDAQLFREARVIACTLVGSANKQLNGKMFSTLFIDEAAQAFRGCLLDCHIQGLPGNTCRGPLPVTSHHQMLRSSERWVESYATPKRLSSVNPKLFPCSKHSTGCTKTSCTFPRNGSTKAVCRHLRKYATVIFSNTTLPSNGSTRPSASSRKIVLTKRMDESTSLKPNCW